MILLFLMVSLMSSDGIWSLKRRDDCIEQGCHRSANDHAEFLRDEFCEFIQDGFWIVLPYDRIRNLDHLMLSPAAVKDEPNGRPRLLCDHTWFGVNERTIPHAPPEAMQFGGTLSRVMWKVRHSNPKFGTVLG